MGHGRASRSSPRTVGRLGVIAIVAIAAVAGGAIAWRALHRAPLPPTLSDLGPVAPEIEALVRKVGVPEASRRLKIPRSSLYDVVKIWGIQSE